MREELIPDSPANIDAWFKLQHAGLCLLNDCTRLPHDVEVSLSDEYKQHHQVLINERKAAEAKEAATRARQEKSDRK